MGDVSVIARRLKAGKIQHGWSGNWGYPSNTGAMIMYSYTDPESVDYLFSLGQLRELGLPGNEETLSCVPAGQAHWISDSESGIFSHIAFIDHAYFYDADEQWYYISPSAFTIKYPLRLVLNTLGSGWSPGCEGEAEGMILKYIFEEYPREDKEFALLLKGEYSRAYKRLLTMEDDKLYALASYYPKIIEYFDPWVVVESDPDFRKVTKVLIRKKAQEHVETIYWDDALNRQRPEPGRYRNGYVRDYTYGGFIGYLSGQIETLKNNNFSTEFVVKCMDKDVLEDFIRKLMEIPTGKSESRKQRALLVEYEDVLWEDQRSAKILQDWLSRAEERFRKAIAVKT